MKQKFCENLMNSTVVFLLAGVVIFFNLKTTSGFSKLAVLLIKFASGTIKQPFGANLMKNSGSFSNFRVVNVLNMKAMGRLNKLAALAIVIKVHKRHNKTTIWYQFDENNINTFLNYRVVVHLNFKTISGLSRLPGPSRFYQNPPVAQENKL